MKFGGLESLFRKGCVAAIAISRSGEHIKSDSQVRSHGRAQGRGASRRKNKDLRALKHHVHGTESTDGLRDVVPPDEGIRLCGP